VVSFVLDANLSIETARFLNQSLGLDVVHLATLELMHLGDYEIVLFAQAEGRVIITFDLDFGHIHRGRTFGRFGFILLRLSEQSIESVNQRLHKFFTDLPDMNVLIDSITVLEDKRSRVGLFAD
jgi:predicted nuclease of predicted toxin-antitoxin system